MGSAASTQLQTVRDIIVYFQDEAIKVSALDVSPQTTLNQFLREKSLLTGTKAMCLEGGCGSCIVAVAAKHPVTKKIQTFTVNSCLVSIFSCHGWKIYTIEGIGNKLMGFHPIQKQLAKFNGTQCGFCSPGMVMSMFALSETNENLTMEDVENSFGGNMCRCTGYRPILSAFKSMVSDADPSILGYVMPDIEDIKLCKKTNIPCTQTCADPCESSKLPVFFDQEDTAIDKWFKVYSFEDLLGLVKQFGSNNYMLVAGNTARGVYRIKEPIDVYIDVTNVTELRSHTLSEKLQLGANISLTETIDIFKKTAKENENFSYLIQAATHIDWIAHPAVRNIGTIAGNLFTKNQHRDFPSDMFILLETIGAKVTIVNAEDNAETILSVEEFIKYDMKMKVMKYITLPPLGSDYIFHSYKIMKRAQNTHAMVNAGFLIKLDASKNIASASIVYGNINPEFVHATEAEQYLIGKPLFNNESMQGVFAALDRELKPEEMLPDPSPEYRKQLAIALYYKFILNKAPPELLTPTNKSGGKMITLERPISKGLQDFETNESMYPLTKPIPKLEALAQTSGEAKYILDRPPAPGQLYAAFVEAKVKPLSIIDKVDASEVLKMPGVVAFIDKKDIPGKNTFTPNESLYKIDEEELFCSGKILYHHQPIGVIVATSQELANKAADLVQVSYLSTSDKPYFTNREILENNATDRIHQEAVIPATSTGADKKFEIKGKMDIAGQYHYTMETQICAVEPVEDGYNMYPGTQWMDFSQIAAAKALNIPESKINIEVRRLGGAYGSKISRATMISTACIVAAHKLKRPVRMWMQYEKNMNIIGKRFPVSADYEASINAKGVVQSLKHVVYSNYGCYSNEATGAASLLFLTSGYKKEAWNLTANHCTTDVAPNTWCRAPGSCEGNAMGETIMEHLSIASGIDPFDLRRANVDKSYDHLINLMEEMKIWSEYTKRQQAVTHFNKNNRWTKRGLTVLPMRYPFELYGHFNCVISIYNGDGSVAVAHGGIEMGQGINTKVAQTVSYLLGIPMDTVSVKPSNNLANANCETTGGSITSEAVCLAASKVCNILLERLAPIKAKMKKYVWKDLIQSAYLTGIDLTATSLCFSVKDLKSYNIFGVTVAEVEVDILTGLQQILRLDLIEDVGNSMSPNIDVGQIEGAVIMGIGYWMLEDLVYDKDGALLNNRTWNYTPPGAKDIPIDFRVRLQKNAPNPAGVFKSKAVAEPPLLMSYSVPMALRRALASARTDAQPNVEKWVPVNGASTPEYTFMNSLNSFTQYKL